ncbi:MAG: Smr/MutS family protein [Rhizobiaceae bacterium]
MKKNKLSNPRAPGSKSKLSAEDSKIWTQVAKTVTPLSEEKGQFLKDEMNRLMEAVSTTSTGSPSPSPSSTSPLSPPLSKKPMNFASPGQSVASQRQNASPNPIEERIVKSIGKGRQAIDARIDLHGMTQDRARFALLDFLQMAQQANHRIVLVITGKGDQGRGVLRENVPRWLSLPAFSQLVNGYRESQSAHGGEGALYVRIRRNKRTSS